MKRKMEWIENTRKWCKVKIEVSEIVSKWNGDKAIVDQNLKKLSPNGIVKSLNKNED